MALIKPIFSYEDLAQLPDDDGKRYEILEGELVVSPAPTRRHQRAVGNAFALLQRAEQAGYGEAYVAPFQVYFAEHEVAHPDVFFIRRDRLGIVTEAEVRGAPDLIVEVLSPSTRGRDRGVKLRTYARHGVSFYWILDPDARTVHPYTLREGGYIEEPVLRAGQTLTCPRFPDITIDVGSLFD